MTKGDRGFVYVLKLQGSPANWYVGATNNVEARICEHFAGAGALWTQKHPPVSVVETLECPGGDPLPLERGKVAEYAMRYGWARVRGGGHVKVDATQPTWLDLEGTKRKNRAMRSGYKKEETYDEPDQANTGGTESIVVVLDEHQQGNTDRASDACDQVRSDLTP